MKTAYSLAIVAVAAISSVASAQSPTSYGRPVRSPALFQRHASTIGEGYLRGAADLTRANGDYNYNTSLALINREQARSLALDNHLKYAQTFFAKRQINREGRAAESLKRPTQQDVIRFSKSRLPKRLDESQYSRALAKVRWPEALQFDRYDAIRAEVDKMISDRAFASKSDDARIKELVNVMIGDLKTNIRSFSTGEYLEAKRFLASMQYEMNFGSTSSSVAVR